LEGKTESMELGDQFLREIRIAGESASRPSKRWRFTNNNLG
jgi:hypothetical protein